MVKQMNGVKRYKLPGVSPGGGECSMGNRVNNQSWRGLCNFLSFST